MPVGKTRRKNFRMASRFPDNENHFWISDSFEGVNPSIDSGLSNIRVLGCSRDAVPMIVNILLRRGMAATPQRGDPIVAVGGNPRETAHYQPGTDPDEGSANGGPASPDRGPGQACRSSPIGRLEACPAVGRPPQGRSCWAEISFFRGFSSRVHAGLPLVGPSGATTFSSRP